jgi:diguanylate cyclase (GGDEF)-like protein/PAS domain S-box-containing protein
MDKHYAVNELAQSDFPTAAFADAGGSDLTLPGLRTFDDRLLQLETIYATLPIALCVIGRDGRIMFANEAYATLVTRNVYDLIGVSLSEINAIEAQHASMDFLTFDGGESMPERELELNGRTYLVSVAPLRGMGGRVEAISVALTEITYRKTLEAKLAIVNRRLADLAVKDHLTGIFNRRYFDEELHNELSRAGRRRVPLSLLMIDVDHFKNYNDTYGHLNGDDCLRDVAACLAATVAHTPAIVCRFGGEEFGVILPGMDKTAATDMAERLRFAVAALDREHSSCDTGRLTVSVGIASQRPQTGHNLDSAAERLLGAADGALYRAKATGRNRVMLG